MAPKNHENKEDLKKKGTKKSKEDLGCTPQETMITKHLVFD